MRRARYCVFLLLMLPLAASDRACAAGGLFGIDHEWGYDNGGIWNRNYQTGLEYAVIATEGAGALWLGNDDPLGHEFWQSIDSTSVALGRGRIWVRINGSRVDAAKAFRVARLPCRPVS
jgi:hypothetical protein